MKGVKKARNLIESILLVSRSWIRAARRDALQLGHVYRYHAYEIPERRDLEYSSAPMYGGSS